MASLLQKIFIAFLSKLRFARDYTKRCLGRLALRLAFLAGRKFSKWWRSRPGKLGTTSQPPWAKPADPPFLGTKANSYSVSDHPAIVKEYTVATSSVPASASHPSLDEHLESQSTTATPMVQLDAIAVDHGTPPAPAGPPGRDPVNRRSASIGSTQSRASDRFSIITTSRDLIHATHDDESSRPPRATHRQFGRGPDPSRSRERISRPNSRPNTPTHPHTPPNPPRLEIITSLPSAAHINGRENPLVPPLASSAYTHEPLGPPSMSEIRRRLSSTSIVANIQLPSTESLPMSPHDEPPDSPTSSPTSSNAATLDYYLPEGRFVQLINSEQIPRYTKNALMQVEYTIISPYPYVSLQTSHRDTL